MKKKSLEGKIAVITGADSGIGQAIADELSKKGASILINYHEDSEGAAKTLALVQENGSKGFIHQADVSDYSEVTKMYEITCSKLGVPYILINSAGIDASGINVVDMDIAVFDKTIRTNLYGIFTIVKNLFPYEKKKEVKGKL